MGEPQESFIARARARPAGVELEWLVAHLADEAEYWKNQAQLIERAVDELRAELYALRLKSEISEARKPRTPSPKTSRSSDQKRRSGGAHKWRYPRARFSAFSHIPFIASSRANERRVIAEQPSDDGAENLCVPTAALELNGRPISRAALTSSGFLGVHMGKTLRGRPLPPVG